MRKKGVVLIAIVLLIVTVSIYLATFVTRTTYDLKILHRDKQVWKAKELAYAGLQRALLYLEDDFKRSGNWADGDIAGISVDIPSPCDDTTLYSFINETLEDGCYNVSIQYVCEGGIVRRDRLWVYSRAEIAGVSPPAMKKLAVAGYVYNVNQSMFYSDINSAVKEAVAGDVLRVAGSSFVENVVVDKSITIEFGYNFDFVHRDPEVYKSIVIPQSRSNYTLHITTGNVTLGGGEIQ